MPVSFVFNKLWTFAAVRTGRLDLADPLFEEELLSEVMVERGCGLSPLPGPGRV